MTGALIPGQPFPKLELPRAGGGTFVLSDLMAPFMTVLNVYRGLHCPRCARQLGDFVEHREGFETRGAHVISISTDPADRADEAVREWGLGDMPVGHSLTISEARELGLFISGAIREGETTEFAEAAIFFIRADGVLWGSSINSFPFLRPTASQVLDAIDTAIERKYPPRGSLVA